MSGRFLVLHGLGNRRPHGHWQRWLVDRLRRRGERVRYPQLPDPDRPDLTAWLDVLATEYAQLGDGERVVICHSLACALWYRASARDLIRPAADRVLLVALPGPSVLAEPATAAFVPRACSRDPLRASSRATRLVASDRDPHCPEGPAARVYGEPLGIRAETIRGAGHLTQADGYGPWPELLAWCLDEEAVADFGASRSGFQRAPTRLGANPARRS